MKRILSLILCAAMLCMLLSGCSKQVEVDTAGLQKILFAGEAVAQTGKDYTAALTPEAYHELPETIRITMDGETLSQGYAYDAETGGLTIPGDLVTGPFSISGQARESIVGSWGGQWDLTEVLLKGIVDAFPTAGDLFKDLAFQVDVKFQFREDGTCTVSVVAESIQNAFDKLVPYLLPLVELVLEIQLETQGYDMSVEDFLKLSGTSLEELIRENLNYDSLLESMGKLDEEFSYQLRENTLQLGEDVQVTFALENGVLTLDNMDGEPVNPIFPLTLTRITE